MEYGWTSIKEFFLENLIYISSQIFLQLITKDVRLVDIGFDITLLIIFRIYEIVGNVYSSIIGGIFRRKFGVNFQGKFA